MAGALNHSIAAQASNSIQIENAKVGTNEWQITSPGFTTRAIEGYASLTSVNRGGQILLYVNTAEPTYTMDIFRIGYYGGLGGRRMMSTISRTGTVQPMPAPDPDTGLIECQWTDPYVLNIPGTSDPTDWMSGIYLIKLTAGSSGTQQYIVFAVRDDSRASDLLMAETVNTYQAYNVWGGKSLYGTIESPADTANKAMKVSFNRPYWGDTTNGAADFLTWEMPMVRFLEGEGYDVAYATSVDIDRDSTLARSHKAFLSVGHDEYWSWKMRDNVEGARDAGVNLGFFSGNVSYWQIRYEPSAITGDDSRTMVGYKEFWANDPIQPSYLKTNEFRYDPVNRSEDQMIGVEFITQARPPFVVEDASHWVFSGTGLHNGDVLAYPDGSGFLGYEVDAIGPNSPANVQRLGHSQVNSRGANFSDMTSYRATSGATVFSTGSIGWDETLPQTKQITRNVLARFLSNAFADTVAIRPTLDSPFSATDIGDVGRPGYVSLVGPQSFTLNGGGRDRYRSNDALYYVSQPLQGDGQIVVRLTALQNYWDNRAGVMIRESLSPDSRYVALVARPSESSGVVNEGVELLTRASTAAQPTLVAQCDQALPNWLKLTRTGDVFDAAVSPDGVTWSAVGSTTVPMGSAVYVGTDVLSAQYNVWATATFDHIAVTGTSGAAGPPLTPANPSPGSNATSISTTPTLMWTASGASNYDVRFGAANPPPVVASAQASATYAPPPLANNTTYFWQVIAHNSNGTTTGAVWTFTTVAAPPPPAPPATPSPADGATGIPTNVASLTWTSTGATSYDVGFGTATPPPAVATAQSAASYTPPPLANDTTYFWQVTAHNGSGTAVGAVWSFKTAAALPSPLQSKDVGAVGIAGSASFNSGQFTIKGAGGDIWGTADAFQFVHQPMSGDGQIVARVLSLQNTDANAKAGLMFRASLAPAAAHVILDVEPSGNIEFMTRTSQGGSTSWLSGATQVAPVFLRLVRAGSTVTGSISMDGSTWTKVGSSSLTGSAEVGLVVTSHTTAQLNTATFDSVAVTATGAGGAPGPPSTPSPTNAATGVSTTPTLTWTSSGATNYDVRFGATNPPPQVSAGQTQSSYVASALSNSTTYFWQIVAHNSAGATVGPIWSFATATTPPPPATPTSPSPPASASSVSTLPTLTWTSSGATSFDVNFGTSNPPPVVTTGQAAASYATPRLANSTIYFWQIVAHNSAGDTSGPIWSFTTDTPPPPPMTPTSPSPPAGASGVSTLPTLTWTSSEATSFDVSFGTSNPPPVVTTEQAAASYAPPGLSNSTIYFWQIVAHNSAGTSTGPIWSFTTAPSTSSGNIVIYASDISASSLHGAWAQMSDASSPNGTKLATADTGFAATSAPLAAPADYVDVAFTASAGVPYTLWLRVQALNNNKFNDSLWVQFSDAQLNGSAIYPMNSTEGLDVNLATDAAAGSLQGWGWVNGAYWLSQPATITFANSGAHTMRIQLREDGVELDQLLLSPTKYFNAGASCPVSCGGAPGPVSNDHTVVPKS